MDCLPCELNRKLVAKAFRNALSEMELHETQNIGHHFLSINAREDLMKENDHNRANTTYTNNVCLDECKKRAMQNITFNEKYEHEMNVAPGIIITNVQVNNK